MNRQSTLGVKAIYQIALQPTKEDKSMQAAQIGIKMQRGKVTVFAFGRTERGQKFIKGYVPLKVSSIGDPKFKKEMAAAVASLLGSAA